MCHHREESPSHYFLDCFLYLPERQTLFDQIEHYIPRFKTLTKQKKLDIILRGIDIENNDLIRTNTTLTIAVQNFILQTNRLTGKCVTVGAFCYFVIFPIMYIFSYLSYTYLNIKFTCLKGKDP